MKNARYPLTYCIIRGDLPGINRFYLKFNSNAPKVPS